MAAARSSASSTSRKLSDGTPRLLALPSLPSLSGATPSRSATGGSGSISRSSNGASSSPARRGRRRRWPTSTGPGDDLGVPRRVRDDDGRRRPGPVAHDGPGLHGTGGGQAASVVLRVDTVPRSCRRPVLRRLLLVPVDFEVFYECLY